MFLIRKMKRKILFVLLLCSFINISAQEQSNISLDVFISGDILNISVVNHEELSFKIRVDSKKQFRYPYCGVISTIDKNCNQLSEEIAIKLDKNNIQDAEVSVFVEEYASRYVYVFGEVNKPLSISFEPGMKLTAIQAISTAEGLSEKADMNNIFIMRKNKNKVEKIQCKILESLNNPNESLFLQSGDTVVVRASKPVSIIGKVKKATVFHLKADLPVTLSKAIAMAEGFDKSDEHIGIGNIDVIRNGKTKEVTIKTVFSNDQSFLLQPGDTVIVKSGRPISVLGQVRAPGVFKLEENVPITMTRAVAMAGGFDKLADMDDVRLIRNGVSRVIDLERALTNSGSSDPVLQPGDIVFVTQTRW